MSSINPADLQAKIHQLVLDCSNLHCLLQGDPRYAFTQTHLAIAGESLSKLHVELVILNRSTPASHPDSFPTTYGPLLS